MKYDPAESWQQKLERVRRLVAERVYRSNPPAHVRAALEEIEGRRGQLPVAADPDARERVVSSMRQLWTPHAVARFCAADVINTPITLYERPADVSGPRRMIPTKESQCPTS